MNTAPSPETQISFRELLPLAHRTAEAAKALLTSAGRSVPKDTHASYISLADDVIAASQDAAVGAILEEVWQGLFFLGNARSGLENYDHICTQMLPNHAEDLATLAKSALILLHIFAFGSDALRRPVPPDTVDRALLLADFIRAHRTPPRPVSAPPVAVEMLPLDDDESLPETPSFSDVANSPRRTDQAQNGEEYGDFASPHPPAQRLADLRAVVARIHRDRPGSGGISLKELASHGFNSEEVRLLVAESDAFALAPAPVASPRHTPAEPSNLN